MSYDVKNTVALKQESCVSQDRDFKCAIPRISLWYCFDGFSKINVFKKLLRVNKH